MQAAFFVTSFIKILRLEEMETGQKNLELLLHCENEFLEVTVHLTKIDMHTVMESVTV